MTIADQHVTSGITVNGGTVAIQRCWFNGSSTTGSQNFITVTGTANVTIEDCLLDGINLPMVIGSGRAYAFALGLKPGVGYTAIARRCVIQNIGNGFVTGSGTGTVLVEDCVSTAHISIGDPATTGSHNVCTQSWPAYNGVSLTMQRCWFDVDTATNASAAVEIQPSTDTARNILLRDCYLNGGAYYALTLDQGHMNPPGPAVNCQCHNNRWGPQGGALSGPNLNWNSASDNSRYNASNPPTYAGTPISP